MPARALCAMKSGASRAASPDNNRSRSRGNCPCTNLRWRRFQPNRLANTQSNSTGTTGTNSESIRGSGSATYAVAKNAAKGKFRRRQV